MPEVPPDERQGPFGSPPEPGRPSPYDPAPRDPLSADVPLTPPPSPFGEPQRRDDESPPFASDASAPSPYATEVAAAALSYGTTGVPYFGPPAPPPTFPYAEGALPIGAAPPVSRRRRAFRYFRGARELAETVILALLIFLLARAVVQNFQVEGRSMQPTFQDGWYLLVNKSIYWEINLDTVHKFIPLVEPGDDPSRYLFRGPQRGDVIVFHPPEAAGESAERDFIKRVIALPGETVEVHDCQVFIDGEPLHEPYLDQPTAGPWGPFTVPPGQYFVLGDNRANSSDSRSWYGVPKDNIIGLAWLTYWPFSAFGLVNNDHESPGDVPADQQDGVPKQPFPCDTPATP